MNARLGLLLAVALLAGCSARETPSAATAPSAAPASAPAPASAGAPPAGATSQEPPIGRPPTRLPKTTAAEPPVDDFQQVVAEGRVRVGGGCVELVTDGLTWTLLGPAVGGLRDGQRVRVTGVPDPNRETGCTASPLLVSRATPA